MKSEVWNTYKLGEIGYFIGGVTSINKEDYGHGTPFLPYKNIFKNSKVNINDLELMNVSQKDIEKRNCIYGDIFFTASSETPDEVAMSSVLLNHVPNLTFNGFSKRFRLNDFSVLLPDYARYLFRDQSFRKDIYQLATGDIRFNISQESLGKVLITIPDVNVQSRIASILSSLDDKIELNLQMNNTLEAIAQAIFKEWFVDFRFPGYDDELVDGLPKGWKVGTILEVADLLSGGTPKTEIKQFWSGTIKWISAKDITTNNGGFILSTEKQISEEGLDKSAARLLPKYTTIVSARGTVGNYCIISEEMAISQTNYGLKAKAVNSDFFIFLVIKNMIEKMKAYSYGTVFDTITTKTFKEIEVILPTYDKIICFNNLMTPLYSRILCNSQQNQTLTQLRDALLPKLMSGQIKV